MEGYCSPSCAECSLECKFVDEFKFSLVSVKRVISGVIPRVSLMASSFSALDQSWPRNLVFKYANVKITSFASFGL